jgi:DNA-binding response OmpR family regulator
MLNKPVMKKSILVIDDDPDILEVVRYVLMDEPYTVTTITDSHELPQLLATDPPDLIVLDDRLPGENGRDICRQLKQSVHTSHIPVIFFSAINDIESVAASCGADACLRKPFNITELLSVVRRHGQAIPIKKETTI